MMSKVKSYLKSREILGDIFLVIFFLSLVMAIIWLGSKDTTGTRDIQSWLEQNSKSDLKAKLKSTSKSVGAFNRVFNNEQDDTEQKEEKIPEEKIAEEKEIEKEKGSEGEGLIKRFKRVNMKESIDKLEGQVDFTFLGNSYENEPKTKGVQPASQLVKENFIAKENQNASTSTSQSKVSLLPKSTEPAISNKNNTGINQTQHGQPEVNNFTDSIKSGEDLSGNIIGAGASGDNAIKAEDNPQPNDSAENSPSDDKNQIKSTPYCLDLWGNVNARQGDIIRVYTPGGILCGQTKVKNSETYGVLLVYLDDPDTEEVEGMKKGEVLTFSINGQRANPLDPEAAICQGNKMGELKQLDLELEQGSQNL